MIKLHLKIVTAFSMKSRKTKNSTCVEIYKFKTTRSFVCSWLISAKSTDIKTGHFGIYSGESVVRHTYAARNLLRWLPFHVIRFVSTSVVTLNFPEILLWCLKHVSLKQKLETKFYLFTVSHFYNERKSFYVTQIYSKFKKT